MNQTPSIQKQIAELKAAGWTRWKARTVWKSPAGTLHLGPHGAWKLMKAAETAKPNH